MGSGILRIKNLTFQRSDGVQINKDVPPNINQRLVKTIDFDDYAIRILGTCRDIAEKEFATFIGSNGDYVGCLIAGSSILSSENPNNENAVFSSYSLIVAAHICQLSFAKNYSLASIKCQESEIMDDVFISGFFYGIFQKSTLPNDSRGIDNMYYASLFASGLVLSPEKRKPTVSSLEHPAYSGKIRLRQCREHPDYIRQIIIGLLPYAENSFLRFFYLYQIIEYLMSEGFKRKYLEVKANLDEEKDMSVTTLRDFLKRLNASTSEDARINVVLQPACATTMLCAEKILDGLEIDRTDFNFSELIYKIRNVIFHDFPKIHKFGEEVGELGDNLLRYIIEEKIQ